MHSPRASRTPTRKLHGLAALAVATVCGVASAAEAPSRATALTLSGMLAAPRAKRSMRVRKVGIRFRAPADLDLAETHLAWRRRGRGCTLGLRLDDDGDPGERLATADLARGRGWQGTPLAARLAGGRVYHLVVTCPARARARLAYVRDTEQNAVATGVWQLEDLRRRVRAHRAPIAPLFALVFTDGSWWGQPYRPARRAFRVCGRDEVSATVVPAAPLTVTGVALATAAREAPTAVQYSIETRDRSSFIAGTLLQASGGFASAAAAKRMTLLPGNAYVIRLRAPGGHAGCVRLRGLVSDLESGPPISGVHPIGVQGSTDGGQTWRDEPATTLARILLLTADDALPIAATTTTITTTTTSSTLATDVQSTTTTTASTPTTSTPTTSRPPTTTRLPTTTLRPTTTTRLPTTTSRPTTTTRVPTTTSRPTTSSTTLPSSSRRSIHASGYIARYDSRTVAVWPERLNLILGEADAEGPRLADARRRAAAADNAGVKFIFYMSFTDLDSRCDCLDQDFYDSFIGAHPEWILRDAGGAKISTHNGFGRLFTTDIGNPDYVEAWGDWVQAAIDRWGWDGVWADNIFRGYFGEWSATPINPRTGVPYTTAQYRRDMLAALRRLVSRFHARGKILIGNHSSAYDSATFADQTIKDQVTTMDGVEVEECIYDSNGTRQREAIWISQLRYLEFANRNGVRTICRGSAGTITDPTKRWYILASHLLASEGESSVAQLNSVDAWWEGLDYDLGAARGGYVCLDPDAGLATSSSCPSIGKIYRRDWERGRVLVNPTASRTVTVPLGEEMLWKGSRVTSVTLAPGSGVVLVRP